LEEYESNFLTLYLSVNSLGSYLLGNFELVQLGCTFEGQLHQFHFVEKSDDDDEDEKLTFGVEFKVINLS